MRPAVAEGDTRAGDKILYGTRDEYFVRLRKRTDARGDVDGDTGQVIGHELAFPSVYTDPNRKTGS